MDDHSYQSDERFFNLQLIIQKLEEELQLYRNGTTATELLDVIHEKDIEIETWRAKCDEKEEKLRRLAKTSGDVLMKHEKLQQELIRQEERKQLDEARYDHLLDENKHLKKQIDSLHQEKSALQAELDSKDNEIGQLQLSVWENHQEAIDNYEKQLTEKALQLEKAREQIISLQSGLQALESSIESWKLREQELLTENHHYKVCMEEQDASITSLQKRCALLVKEKNEKFSVLDHDRQEMIQQVQKFRDSMTENLLKREELIRKKDEKIREMQFQLTILQQEIKLKNQRLLQGFNSDAAQLQQQQHGTAGTGAAATESAILPPPVAVAGAVVRRSTSSSSSSAAATSSNGRAVLGEKTNMVLHSTTSDINQQQQQQQVPNKASTMRIVDYGLPASSSQENK